jgi:hypothetical protein
VQQPEGLLSALQPSWPTALHAPLPPELPPLELPPLLLPVGVALPPCSSQADVAGHTVSSPQTSCEQMQVLWCVPSLHPQTTGAQAAHWPSQVVGPSAPPPAGVFLPVLVVAPVEDGLELQARMAVSATTAEHWSEAIKDLDMASVPHETFHTCRLHFTGFCVTASGG